MRRAARAGSSRPGRWQFVLTALAAGAAAATATRLAAEWVTLNKGPFAVVLVVAFVCLHFSDQDNSQDHIIIDTDNIGRF